MCSCLYLPWRSHHAANGMMEAPDHWTVVAMFTGMKTASGMGVQSITTLVMGGGKTIQTEGSSASCALSKLTMLVRVVEGPSMSHRASMETATVISPLVG